VTPRTDAGTAVRAGWRRWPRAIGHVGGLSPRPLTPSALLRALARFGVRPAALPRRARLAWILGAYAVGALLWYLDRPGSAFALDRAPELRHAAAFGFIVTALEIFSSWVAAAAEVTAAYVWIALQWLAATTASFLVSTGAMFARIWDGVKIVWSDVLKPALVWIDDNLKRLQAWLKDTFQPVFDFLKEVRCRLETFYKTFVRPVTDTIEFIRQVNRVLLTFHIDVLQKLDRVLQQVEQRIDEPFLWVNQKLNEITNFINSIVTLDGLFERLRLVKSMSRYAPAWLRIATAARTRPLNGDDAEVLQDFQPRGPTEVIAGGVTYLQGQSGDVENAIAAAVANAVSFAGTLT
jgi:hypothetical protein